MNSEQLFTVRAAVKPEWIDYNGHMNMGFYLVAFDYLATDRYFNFLELGVDHFGQHHKSTFTLGANIDYLQEVMEGDQLRFTTQLVDYDHKRLHYFHCMYNDSEGYLASVNECLTMYMDMDTRRGTSFNEEQMARFAAEMARGEAVGRPGQFGRRLGIRR